jgi:diaminopimelate decarboxylase
MDHFEYRSGELYAEDVPLRDIAADYGTPCYVYSRATLERHWHAFDNAFADHPHLVCFAVKANSNLGVLNVLARLGSGFDIVSVGELERVLAAGGDPGKVVFSGVGKRADEMQRALAAGIRCFNVESAQELERLERLAAGAGKVAPVALRVNPDVDPQTHPYIATGLKENKFGIAIDEAPALYRRAMDSAHLAVSGVDCHIGSQLTQLAPFLDALDRVLLLVGQLRDDGIPVDHLDLGGGLGVRYDDETPPLPDAYAIALLERLRATPYEILIEPGRAIAANAGVLLTRVEYLKHGEAHDFGVIDAAMNDLIRPSLYQAWQAVVGVEQEPDGSDGVYDLVGPVCETGDFIARQRRLRLRQGSLLAVRSAGAYGFSMASNYNSRPRPAEVMVDGRRVHVVRRRETVAELFAGESLLPE